MEVLITPMALAHPLYSLEAGRVISAENCELDDAFPPDDLGPGLYTPFISYLPYIIAAL